MHPIIGRPQDWTYINQGSNNLILVYKQSDEGTLKLDRFSHLKDKILRIKKGTNKDFYKQSLQVEQDFLNTRYIENILSKHPVLKNFTRDSYQTVDVSTSYIVQFQQFLISMKVKNAELIDTDFKYIVMCKSYAITDNEN